MHQVGHESVAAAFQPAPRERVNVRNDLDQLLHALHNELTDLSKKRADIGGRIRILDKILRGLRSGVGQASFAPLKVGLRQQQLLEPDELNPPLPQLKRACRIALAEAGGPASPEDLRARIARRGSFPFTNAEGPIAAIARTLRSMAEQGEVRRHEDGQNGRWECAHEQESPTIKSSTGKRVSTTTATPH